MRSSLSEITLSVSNFQHLIKSTIILSLASYIIHKLNHALAEAHPQFRFETFETYELLLCFIFIYSAKM